MLITLLLNLLGFALLALSQSHHRERVYGQNSTPALVHPRQRAIGFIAIFLGLGTSIASQGASFGILLWVLLMSASAFAVALTLTWHPRWLRGSRIFMASGDALAPDTLPTGSTRLPQ